MIVGVHIIILYTSEGKIVAEGFGLRSRQREDLQSGMERKTPDYAKNSNSTTLKSAVASYICIANCAILFALDLVLRRPETSATKGDCVQCPIGWWTESDRMADGIRSDGERNLIGRRTESDRMADATKGQKLRLRHEKRYGERHTLL